MRDLYVISIGLQIIREFGLSVFGLSGKYLYERLQQKLPAAFVCLSCKQRLSGIERNSEQILQWQHLKIFTQ